MHVEKNLTIKVNFNHLIQYNNKRKGQQKLTKYLINVSLVPNKNKTEEDDRQVKMQ